MSAEAKVRKIREGRTSRTSEDQYGEEAHWVRAWHPQCRIHRADQHKDSTRGPLAGRNSKRWDMERGWMSRVSRGMKLRRNKGDKDGETSRE